MKKGRNFSSSSNVRSKKKTFIANTGYIKYILSIENPPQRIVQNVVNEIQGIISSSSISDNIINKLKEAAQPSPFYPLTIALSALSQIGKLTRGRKSDEDHAKEILDPSL